MLNRRQFIWGGAAVGGGLAVGFVTPKAFEFIKELKAAPPLGRPGWIHVAPDGGITVYSTATEMGQGIWTTIAQCVCDELDADWSRIRVQMAPGIRAFFSPMGYATGGSSSTRLVFRYMRTLAAQARAMLIAAASKQWSANPTECDCESGWVVHTPTARRLSFGELANTAGGQAIPKVVPLKERTAWRWMGRSIPRVEGTAKINGTAQYGIDLVLPGMLVAAVAQAPFSTSALGFVNREVARAQPGVREVVVLADTVAVIADTLWRAQNALKKAEVRWSAPPGMISSKELRGALLRSISDKPNGANDQAFSVTAIYSAPLLMHMQLEPLNATACVSRMSAEVWAPTQWQSQMQADVAKALGIWRHSVTIHSTLVGGGFGRRLSTDDGVTAALIAKHVQAPVKCIWSREEDSGQARFRPMSASSLSARLGENGNLTELHVNLAGLGKDPRTAAFERIPYAIGQSHTRYVGIDAPVRIGSWRSVDASQNLFYLESFIDECAHAAGTNGFALRQRLLAHDERASRVLTKLAELARIDERSNMRFIGVAFSNGFESVAAQAVEIERAPDGSLRVARVYAVVDCGTAINPAMIEAQVEGGVLFGLSAALREEALIENGALQTTNYDTYPVLRMKETPTVSVVILETPNAPIGGIGEVAVPLVAPALGNAIFAATGIRVRHLPFSSSSELKWT